MSKDQNLKSLPTVLYNRALNSGDTEFRTWALEELNKTIPYSGCIWRRLTSANRRIYGVSSVDLAASFSSAWDRNKDADPLARNMQQQPNTVHRMASLDKVDTPFQSPLYHSLYKPQGIAHAMGVEYQSAVGAPVNEVMLFRSHEHAPFSNQEAEQLETFVIDAIEAAACAHFVNLSRPQAPYWQQVSALADSSGRLYEVQGEFLALIHQHYPDWDGQELPFPIRHTEHNQVQRSGPLRLYTSQQADLILIRAWESANIDLLSPQERSIVNAVCQGKTYKAIAKEMDLAASTVSTHVYSACKKIGVRGKNALIQAVSAHPDEVHQGSGAKSKSQ